jgi:hypothetical protein
MADDLSSLLRWPSGMLTDAPDVWLLYHQDFRVEFESLKDLAHAGYPSFRELKVKPKIYRNRVFIALSSLRCTLVGLIETVTSGKMRLIVSWYT